ncbi:uncharacterized protein LOC117322745 [Pecten maximus]|uniref:uncharacterized protein LOC117322745 n=1 Tax=Pecten maximus TaxID=6579 RepID=UPI001458F5BC|nr:uncharacterized protein LOC117322745 [Pecten maximus]
MDDTLNSNVKDRLSPDKKQTKADISQLAGFLKVYVKADSERSVGVIEGNDTEDDFDYSLDLMGEHSLDAGDNKKEPSTFEAGQSTYRTRTPVKQTNTDVSRNTIPCVSVSQEDTNLSHYFTPEIDFALGTTPDNGEYDIFMNSRRGYTYINSSRHRGIKRRITYDEDQQDPLPCKRLRTC